jgi:hypothetical protein
MMRFNQYCVKIRSRITWDLTSLSHKLVVIHTLVQFPCGTCLVLFVLITRRQYVTWLYLLHLNAKSSPAQTRRRRCRNHSLPSRTQASGGRRMCSYVFARAVTGSWKSSRPTRGGVILSRRQHHVLASMRCLPMAHPRLTLPPEPTPMPGALEEGIQTHEPEVAVCDGPSTSAPTSDPKVTIANKGVTLLAFILVQQRVLRVRACRWT